MAHDIVVDSNLSKKDKYELVLTQLKALTEGESNKMANLANTTALLREVFGWFWIGFYLVEGDELILAPFQGGVACTRIKRGRGVCGTAWSEAKTLVVDDVEQFPGHIACSSLSRSEIVVPIFVNGIVVGVLDVDSNTLASFDEDDKEGLESVCEIVASFF